MNESEFNDKKKRIITKKNFKRMEESDLLLLLEQPGKKN